MARKFQIRRDTTANWTSANPTLAQGEIAYDLTTKYFYIGDGSTAWLSLTPYHGAALKALNLFDSTQTTRLGVLGSFAPNEGDLFVEGAAGPESLTPGASGQILQAAGAAAAPAWKTVGQHNVQFQLDDTPITDTIGAASFSATPVVSEGTELFSISYTPAFSAGLLEIEALLSDITMPADCTIAMVLFIGSTPIAATRAFALNDAIRAQFAFLKKFHQLASAATVTISLRAASSSSTPVINDGFGLAGSYLAVREWKAPPL